MGNGIEILDPEKDQKEKPLTSSARDEAVEKFMYRWRTSEFYPFVMKVLNDEISMQYLNEIMDARYKAGDQMSNDEIGEQARIEYQTKARLLKVREVIE